MTELVFITAAVPHRKRLYGIFILYISNCVIGINFVWNADILQQKLPAKIGSASEQLTGFIGSKRHRNIRVHAYARRFAAVRVKAGWHIAGDDLAAICFVAVHAFDQLRGCSFRCAA